MDTDVIGQRAAALFVDLVLSGLAVIAAFLLVIGLFTGSRLSPGGFVNAVNGFTGVIGVLLLFTAFTLPTGLYWFLCEGLTGKTPGKHLFDLHVVTEHGNRIGWRKSFIRNVLRPVDMIAGGGVPYLVGLLCVLLTDDQQRIGDMAADTYVAADP